jgi:AcrR family transcriptional regulator
MTPSSTKRTYNSSRRTLQAAQTRDAVVHAAMARFPATGWGGTTLADIAAEAGVSVETIYKGFGSKKGLLRATIDAAVVGDTEPIPLSLRPEYRALGEGPLEERIARAAAMNAAIQARSAGVWQALVEAASADPEVDGWRLELEQRRHAQIADSITLVLGEAPDDDLTSLVWVLYSSDTYLRLVHDRGYTLAEYEAFLVDATARLVAGRR